MPRHRPSGPARHAAPNHRSWSYRAVLSAVISTVLTATAEAVRIAGRPESRRTIRGMAYTPWLTVSVGLVAAAMVTLAVPHAAITLPPAPSGTCALSSCQVGHRVDRESAAKRRARLTLPARRPVRRPVARPAVQVELTFAVLAEHQGRFLATIEIRGGRPLGHWTLRFVLPGGTVMRVVWGRWATSGQGVIIYGSPPSWRHGKGDEVRLLVYGTGTPGWPSACAFDGAPCAFVAPSR